MTSSEPAASGTALPAPPPPAAPPGSSVSTAPLRRMVPLDTPARTNPLTIAVELILFALGAAVTVPALLFGADPADMLQLLIGLLAIAARAAGWWFRTYTVRTDTITIDEGILQRRHRVVPLSRIQQVELRQPLLARLFGLVLVHIETAGTAGSTAISLRSLDRPTAEALRHHLLAEQRRIRQGDQATGLPPGYQRGPDVEAGSETVLVTLGPSALARAGATSGTVAVLAPLALVPAAAAAAAAGTTTVGVVVLVLVTVALIALGATVAATTMVVRAWGFRLTLVGDDLQVVQGLLDKREHTMPRHRLQHARITDNPLRRPFRVVSVHLHSAASPGRTDQQQAHLTIPLVQRDDLDDLLALCMGSERWRVPALTQRPPAARRRALVRRVAVTAVAAAALSALAWPAGAVLLPLGLVGWPWGRAAHRRAGSALDGPVVAVASGVVVHHLELIPAERVQSARTLASPFQRRLALATLRLDVAGSTRLGLAPGLGDLPQQTASAARRTVPRRAGG